MVQEGAERLDVAPEHWPRIDVLLRVLATRLTHIAEGRTAALDGMLRNLRERLREPLDEEPLQQLAHELTDAVRALDAPMPSGTPVAATLAGTTAARDALLALISALELGPSEAADLAEIHAGLEDADAARAPQAPVAALAQLLNRTFRLHADQRAALQHLLALVTGQLGELAQYLEHDNADRDAGLAARHTLDQDLAGEIDALGGQLEAAPGLGPLQAELKSRMSAITAHLQAFHDQEDARLRAWQERSARLDGRIHELERSARDMEATLRREHERATTDPLTGIPNRAVFDTRMRELCSRPATPGTPGCLLVLDIDLFKQINDRYGHAAGDRALCIVAHQLLAVLRPGDLLARYGGEEFVVILPHADQDAGRDIAERLRRRIEETQFHGRRRPVHITISCGITTLRAGDTPDAAFERADQAVYAAKRGGRNRCELR